MNQEIKQKWLEALRSGKYKQGRLGLRNKQNEFCCLGVLCDVLDNNKWLLDELWSIEFYKYDDSISVANEELIPLDIQDDLMSLNDNYLYNFNKIADYIEENL